jgi:hypothetical protein
MAERIKTMTNNQVRRAPPKNGILVQHEIPPTTFAVTDTVDFQINFKCADNGDTFMVTRRIPQDIPDLSVHIQGNFRIVLRLTDKNWKWSTTYQAITTKFHQGMDPHYGSLQYKVGNRWLAFADLETLPQPLIVTHVRIDVKHKAGTVEYIDEFCWNLDFKIKDQSLWLPVTVDPEVINPKNPGLIRIDSNVGEFDDGSVEYAMFGYEGAGVDFARE